MLLRWTLLMACAVQAQPPHRCNGHAEYCSRRYSDITFLGAHNSAFFGTRVTQNQEVPPAAQLDYGVRFLTAAMRRRHGVAHLCHTSCTMEDAGTLHAYLGKIGAWLARNPNEVVTLLLTQGQRLDVGVLDQVFRASGVAHLAFVPLTSPAPLAMSQWPTLGELIASGKRLVVFLGTSCRPPQTRRGHIDNSEDYHTDTARVPYLLPEFEYYFETPFSPTDPLFRSCDVHRPPNATASGSMYLVNHNLNKRVGHKSFLVPDWRHAPRTNSMIGSSGIGYHAGRCYQQHGRRPNVILVDYITQGEVLQTQELLNGFRTLAGTTAETTAGYFDISSPVPGFSEAPKVVEDASPYDEDDLCLAIPSLRHLSGIQSAGLDDASA
ncbi:hypothetical protein KEM52_005297 [Ascosphaera acerosa]|nr:hypothetical protein KEM52_005297 [Ascosphaera acerosa]